MHVVCIVFTRGSKREISNYVCSIRPEAYVAQHSLSHSGVSDVKGNLRSIRKITISHGCFAAKSVEWGEENHSCYD